MSRVGGIAASLLLVVAVSYVFALVGGSQAAPECIAPADPGGAWDMTCRSVARFLDELGTLPRSMRVINMPGAGGGIAFANVVANRADDESVIQAASTGTTLRLAQKQFGRFSEKDVRWVAAIASDYGSVIVRADAPWTSLPEFVAAWKADPGAMVFGGGSPVGGQDHVKVVLLARSAGIDPKAVRYVPFDGGGEALTTLLGGFIQAAPADTSEAVGPFGDGTVRVLAVMSPRRLSGTLAEIPTARELGYDAEWVMWRGFFAPRGISATAYAKWASDLENLARTPEWTEFRDRSGLYPFLMSGMEFEAYVAEEMERFRDLTAELRLAQ